MKIFNHVQIKVKDLQVSRKLYDALMKVLGYPVVIEIGNTLVGYGTSVHDMLELRQFDENYPLSQSVHVAFNASNKESVDNFHQTALVHGANCRGEPGLRPEYEEGYYAAFVVDPDGHNLEAVFKII